MTTEQATEPVFPELYDVEAALLEVARARRRRDEPTIAVAQLAERLSSNLVRHFGPEATETAGLALVIAAASIGVLVREGIPAEAITNLLAFAGQRIVVDARTADGGPVNTTRGCVMAVYVDSANIRATVGRLSSTWCHLTADTKDELHEFAARIGLRRSWFQDDNPVPGKIKMPGGWHYERDRGEASAGGGGGSDRVGPRRVLRRDQATRPRRTRAVRPGGIWR